jgi:hypothetical protein
LILELVETSKSNPISVFVDNSQRTENVECIVNSSLRIFEVQFLQSNHAYQASFLVDLKDFVSDFGACSFCLGLDFFQDFSGQKNQFLVVSGSLSSF